MHNVGSGCAEILPTSIDFTCRMFIFQNMKEYFAPHTIPSNVFKFSTVSP